jgi:hypothetical protein
VAAVWRQQAQRVGHRGLLELARAWQISMVQGLRHHAAAARDVRRSERQVLARRSAYGRSDFDTQEPPGQGV